MRNDYNEDELDRMRARKKNQGKSPRPRPDSRREERMLDIITDDSNDLPIKRNKSAKRTVKASPPPARKQPAKKKRRRRRFFIPLVFVLMVFAFFYGKRWLKDRDGYWNIAVFGVDSRDGNLDKGTLADVQMIASINKKTGEIRLVSVYRDTYAQINSDGKFHKINQAYQVGGHQQAVETLERNLDLSIDDYATFNWKAVADVINILGGIDLEITDSEFKYINSFITETVESTGIGSYHLEHAGMNHLDGVQAVAYSRLRLMDTDFQRTQRQRKVVSLAMEKAKSADFNTLKTIVATILPEISTSIGVEDILPLAKNMKKYHLGETGGFPFSKTTADIGKLDCVIPTTLESNVILLHQFLYDLEEFQPSQTVKQISAVISEKSGYYESGKASGADGDLGGTVGKPGSKNPPQKPPESSPPTQPPDDTASETQTNPEPESTETSAAETAEEIPTIDAPPPESSAESSGHIDGPESFAEPTTEIGPGITSEPASESATVYYTRPAETTTEGYGPGFE